jgi:hypothetical protein
MIEAIFFSFPFEDIVASVVGFTKKYKQEKMASC